MTTSFECAALLTAIFLAGCGRVSGVPANLSNNTEAGYSVSGNNGTGSTSSNLTNRQVGPYTCPAEDDYNVTPNNSQGLNVVAYYQVCTNSNTEDQVLVFGNATSRDQICVFPSYSQQTGTDAQTVAWQTNPATANTTNVPWYYCAQPGSNGAEFTFAELTTWNGAYIVDAAYASQMQKCLEDNNVTECPQYSYGTFR
jgi:hypothetical protein